MEAQQKSHCQTVRVSFTFLKQGEHGGRVFCGTQFTFSKHWERASVVNGDNRNPEQCLLSIDLIIGISVLVLFDFFCFKPARSIVT